MPEAPILAPVQSPGDADLVIRLKSGDEAAFRDLVRGMHRALHKVAMAFVGSAASAEEVVQETWLAVVTQLDRFEGRAGLRTLIGAILVNRAKTRGVRDKRSVPFSALDDEGAEASELEGFSAGGYWSPPPGRWDSAPESLVLRKEAPETIERQLESRPPAQRTLVVLRDLEEWSSEEVCNVLEITETNQRVLLHRGRMRLRGALERYHHGRTA